MFTRLFGSLSGVLWFGRQDVANYVYNKADKW